MHLAHHCTGLPTAVGHEESFDCHHDFQGMGFAKGIRALHRIFYVVFYFR